MKIVLMLLCVVFAVLGLSEFLHIIKLFFIFPKRKLCAHIVVNLQNETAQKQILYICEQYFWHGKSFADFIVFNANSLNEENYLHAKAIAEKYGFKLSQRI